jgi:hypothetical protein
MKSVDNGMKTEPQHLATSPDSPLFGKINRIAAITAIASILKYHTNFCRKNKQSQAFGRRSGQRVETRDQLLHRVVDTLMLLFSLQKSH